LVEFGFVLILFGSIWIGLFGSFGLVPFGESRYYSQFVGLASFGFVWFGLDKIGLIWFFFLMVPLFCRSRCL
jgi:hypothetical protein